MYGSVEVRETPAGAVEAAGAAPVVKNRWRYMGILTAAQAMDNSESSVLPTLFPVIKASLGLSLSSLGVLMVCSKIAAALFSPFWLWLARRWNRKSVLFVCTGVWGAWGVAAGFAHNFTALLVCTSVLAVGTAGASALITSIFADLFDDAMRGRAVGYMYGATALVTALMGPLLGHLADIDGGWRIGFWLLGGVSMLAGLGVLIGFRDPGVGASQAVVSRPATVEATPVWRDLRALFRIPTFGVMLVSRLLAGQLLIMSFGVVYLTQVFGFPNRTAAFVIAPTGIGYLLGTIGGAVIFDRMHRRWPDFGRVAFLQIMQVAFGVLALTGTQLNWGSIHVFGVFFFMMGCALGALPGANRPIVMAVVPPRLRSLAFMILIAIAESLTWAAYNAGAGWFGDRYGLKSVFMVVVVGFVFVNGALITVLYRTYPRDVARMQDSLRENERGQVR
ncbi:MFS transporter [Burkholderia sp. Ac-20344]|uniref:MFS transporter n=1 Tax=Burkholderia sp. Ac-20344 TaxID=2703890 RepID=UPI00197BFC04|nr:MFS transporter [Burkholderia sp. Ac-20344]MBN3835767.1 MFS transporter [Burkholderia sp. Ac-20344]